MRPMDILPISIGCARARLRSEKFNPVKKLKGKIVKRAPLKKSPGGINSPVGTEKIRRMHLMIMMLDGMKTACAKSKIAASWRGFEILSANHEAHKEPQETPASHANRKMPMRSSLPPAATKNSRIRRTWLMEMKNPKAAGGIKKICFL